jgi:hypothetical protein
LVVGCVLGPLALALSGLQQGRPFRGRWTALMAHGLAVIGRLWFPWALLLSPGD